jgi:membrane-bound lytic murein transglycosylase B
MKTGFLHGQTLKRIQNRLSNFTNANSMNKNFMNSIFAFNENNKILLIFEIKKHSLLMTSILGIILINGCSSTPKSIATDQLISTQFPQTTLDSIEYAKKRMMDSGIDPGFVSIVEKNYIHQNEIKIRDQVIQMNVLGFLNPGDHSKHFTPRAVKNIRKFVKKYGKSLRKAESEFGVPKEVIASLLWVETRHGQSMGSFNISGVFFSLIQGSHPEIARKVFNELSNRKPSSASAASKMTYGEIQTKVTNRLLQKSQWAIEQLSSIEAIHKESKTNSDLSQMIKFKSSFAGAFGCSQFIPSSFEKYARSITQSKSANLFDIRDCIYSVGNYLKEHGWKNEVPDTHSDALYAYNRVRDYGDVILKLANAVKVP